MLAYVLTPSKLEVFPYTPSPTLCHWISWFSYFWACGVNFAQMLFLIW